MSLAGAIAQSEVPLKQMNGTLRAFGQTLKNTVKWELSSNIIHGLESAISGAVSYAKNLNTSLTNIRIVTGQSVEDMAKFAIEANKAARALSTTTKAYADASLIYYQQGDSVEQAAKKAEITLKAANSSFNTSASEMSEYLTAVWNSYQVGADELERYVDIMAALGAKTATSLEEIATSMQKVAATANTVGVSMEQVSSIVATVSSVTRESAESIGTSYKTIFARIGDLKLGDTLEDGVNLGQVSSQLDKIGVAILDANGDMRDMGAIIEDLGDKWQTMTRAEQTAIAQVVAGKRQYTQLMALFENWDMYQNNMNIAQTSSGALQDMQDTYAESWKAASDQVTASLENIYGKIINDQAIIKFTKSISDVIDTIGGLIDAFGGIGGVLGSLGAIGVKVFEKQLMGSIDRTIGKITTYFKQFSGVKDFGTKLWNRQTKNTKQLQWESAAKETQSNLQNTKNELSNKGQDTTAITYAQDLLSAKQRLIDVEHTLSAAEKNAASAAIANLSQQQQAVLRLKEEKQQLLLLSKQQGREDLNAVVGATASKTFQGKGKKRQQVNRTWAERSAEITGDLQKGFNETNKASPLKYITQADASSLDALYQKAESLSKKSSAIDNLLMNINTGNKNIETLKQKVEALTGHKSNATTVDDLIKDLERVQTEANEAQNEITDLVNNSFVSGNSATDTAKNQAAMKGLQNAQNRGMALGNLEYSLVFKESSIQAAKDKLKDLLNPKSEAYSKLANNITKASYAASSLTAGLSSGKNIIMTMSDESATLGDKLSSVAGGITSLMTSFATGGWIGLAASAIGMIVSGISEAKKLREEEEKRLNQEKADFAKKEADALLEEQSTINSLIETYYQLEDSKKVLTNSEYVQNVLELTAALAGETTTIQGLIAKYGDLDTAIEKMRLQKLQETRDQLQAGLEPQVYAEETNFIDVGKVGSNNYYALKDRAIADIAGAVQQEYARTLSTEDQSSIMIEALTKTLRQAELNAPEIQEGSELAIYKDFFAEASGGKSFFDIAQSALENSIQKATNENINWDLGFFYDILEEQLMSLPYDQYLSNDYALQMMASLTETLVRQYGDVDTQQQYGIIDPGQISWWSELDINSMKLDDSEQDSLLESIYNSFSISNLGNTEMGIASTEALPEDIASWIQELQIGVWTSAEEFLAFYQNGKELMDKYPNLKTNTTFTEWFNGLSYLENYGEVITQIQEIDAELGLANKGFTASAFSNITDYTAFADQAEEAINYLVNEQGYDYSAAKKKVSSLIAGWGILPDIANDFNTILDLAELIASQTGANPEEVKTHLENFYSEYGRDVFSSINFGAIEYTPGQGFNQQQLLKTQAYSTNIAAVETSNKSKAAAQALLDLSDEEIKALSLDAWNEMSADIDWKTIEGSSISSADEWIKTANRKDREKYLQGIIKAEETSMSRDNGILEAAAQASRTYAESLNEIYIAATQDKNSKYILDKQEILTRQANLEALSDDVLKNIDFTSEDIVTKYKDFGYTEADIEWLKQYSTSLKTKEGPKEEDKTRIIQMRNAQQSEINARQGYVSYIDNLPSIQAGLIQQAEGYEAEKDFLENTSQFTDSESIDTFGNSIKVLTNDMSNLQTEFNALNSINIEEIPLAGTQAYKELDTVLKATGKSMADYSRMSQKERAQALGDAKKKNLEDQKTKQESIASKYKEEYGFTDATTYEAVLAEGNQDKITAYQNWQNILSQIAELGDQIIQTEQETADNITKIGAANTEAAIAKFEQEQKKLKTLGDNMMEAANVLADHIDGSEMSFAEQAKLDPAVLEQWKQLTTEEQRAKFAAEQVATAYKKQMEYQQNINDGITSASTFMQNFGITDTNLENTVFIDKGKFEDWLNLSSLSESAKSALIDAWDAVDGTLRDGATAKEWGDAIRAELSNMGDDGEAALAQIEAAGKDSLSNIFTNFSEKIRQEAQEAADAWLDAFNKIKNARKTLIEGGSLMEDIAGDPETLLTYLESYRKTKGHENATAQDLITAIKNGSITAEDLSLDSANIWGSKVRQQYGFNLTSTDNLAFGTTSIYQDKSAIAKMLGFENGYASASSEEQAEIDSVLKEYYANMLKSTEGLSDSAALIKAQNIIDNNQYEQIVQARENLIGAIDASAEGLDTMANYDELKATRDKTIEDKEKEIEQYNKEADEYSSYSDMASKFFKDQTDQPTQAILGDTYSETEYLDIVNTALKAMNKEQVSSLDDVTHDTWGELQIHFEEQSQSLAKKAADAGEEIVKAGTTFAETVKSIFGENSSQYTEASEELDTFEEEQSDRVRRAGIDKTETYQYQQIQSDLDLAESRQEAITGMLSANTIDDMATAANALREAYAGADEETQQWVENLIAARKAGEDGIKANKKLTSQHIKSVKEIKKMSKAQRDQYKEMLRANNVTVDGHKKLEDYFETIDKNIKTIEEAEKHFENFDTENYVQNMADAGDATADTADVVEDVLPASMQSAADEITSISQTIASGGTIFDSLSNWLQDDGTFSQSINDVLGVMGAGADQIAAMQAQVQAQVQQNGSIGTVDWLQVFADANVDPSQFDSIIAALNSAMARIQSLLAKNGITLDPPWTPVPTLSGMGVGRGGGGGKTNPAKSSGGGGGGGGNKQKEDKLRFKDEVERYHTENEVLDRTAEKLDKISKLKERAYGKNYISQIDAETEALREQYEAQAALYNAANQYQAADRADLIGLGVGVQFDADGNISNYEDVMKALMEQYNAEVERYNNSGQGEGDRLRLDNAKEKYEDAKQTIEDYEEAIKTANDALNEMEEIQNQISENALEKVTYELELNIEMNERDLELLELFKTRYEDTLYAQDELFGSLMSSASEYESNLVAVSQAYQQLLDQYAAGILNDADYAEGLTQLSEQLVDTLSSLEDIKNEIAEVYSNTLEMAREEIEHTTDALNHFNDTMQSYIDIAGLAGDMFFTIDGETITNSYRGLQTFYDAQYQNNIQRINIQKAHLDALLEEEARFRAKMKSGEQLSDIEKKQYEALAEQIRETRDELLSNTQESMEAIRAAYENTINAIAKDLDSFLAGSATSISHLTDQYSYFQEEQSRYVSTAQELYEVSKLNRDIEESLQQATTEASKEALKALQEKINKQSELNELTEYDIQMNQLQYQLLLARIQLEEAQNAKDVVRLTRDENGNYAYRYTANQDKVNEAVSQYENTLQQINDLTVQKTSEIENQMISAMQQYTQMFNEINTDYTLSTEERNAKLAELQERFSETMLYLQEQSNIATENLTDNQTAIAEHYGVALSTITASTAGNVNTNIQSMLENTEALIEAMNTAIFGEDGANTAWSELQERLGIVNAASGTAYTDMINSAEDMAEMNTFAAQEALNTITVLEETIEPLSALTDAWDAHSGALEGVINYYSNLTAEINQLVAALADLDNAGGIPPIPVISEENNGSREFNITSETDPEIVESFSENFNKFINGQELTVTEMSSMAEDFTSLMSYIDNLTAQIFSGAPSAQSAPSDHSTRSGENWEQQVIINAEFPNVVTQDEIIAAFMSLADRAQQFVNEQK